MSVVKFTIHNNQLTWQQLNLPDHQRGDSVITLTNDAFAGEEFPKQLNLSWIVYCGDRPIEVDNRPRDKYTFSCVEIKDNCYKAYPCFSFDKWLDVGIKDYEELITNIEKKALHNHMNIIKFFGEELLLYQRHTFVI